MTNRTRQTTFDESLGRLRVKNTTGFEIPPYSCVAIGSASDGVAPGAMDRDGEGLGNGVFLIDVRQVDARAIATGSPGQFLFTLNAPIPAGRSGYATASLPVWARIQSVINDRGTSVMPQAGRFDLCPGSGYWTVTDWKAKDSQKYGFLRADHNSPSVMAFTIGGINAATLTTIFAEQCQLYHVIDNGTTITRTPLVDANGSPVRVRVANLSRSGRIPANTFIGISRWAGGAFIATWQDC